MNANEVYNPDDNSISTSEEEGKLVWQLTEARSSRRGELLKQYLTGNPEEVSKKRERLESILEYFRIKSPRETRYFFSPTLAEQVLDLLDNLKVKKSRKPRRNTNDLTLEGIFGAPELVIDFKRDFRKVLKQPRTKTKTFQLTLHYLYQTKKDFPRSVAPLTRLFVNEFGKEMGKKCETLRKGLKFEKDEQITIPTAISEAFKKYTTTR